MSGTRLLNDVLRGFCQMILLPTRRRVELLKRFIQSIKDTEVECSGLVLVDEKDNADNNDEYAKIWADLPKGWEFKITKAESMGDKVREVWPAVEAANPKWVALLNDDHVSVTRRWDKILGELIDGTNMVSTNDGGYNFGLRVVGVTAWSFDLVKAVGFPLFPRNLQHLYIDDVWKAIGTSTGCWLETLRINVEHRHVMRGMMEQDDTHKKVYSQASWADDSKEFQAFMEQDFKDVCGRVMKLREPLAREASFV